MKAFQFVEWQQPSEIREVPVPEPGPGQQPDPETELDNLYVVHTSFYPSIGAVNPALNRDGECIARWRSSAGKDEVAEMNGNCQMQRRKYHESRR